MTALLALQVFGVALQRYSQVTTEVERTYAQGPIALAELIRLLDGFEPDQRQSIAQKFATGSKRYFLRPLAGLHPDDVRDAAFEQRALAELERSGLRIAELRIGRRSFGPLPDRRPPGIDPKQPRGLSLGSAPRAATLAGRNVPVWVTGDYADRDPTGETPRLSDPASGPPRSENPIQGRLPSGSGPWVEVATYAIRLDGEDTWTTLYQMLRAPRVNLQVTTLLFSFAAAFFIGALTLIIGRQNMRPMKDLRRGAALLGRGERAPDVPVRGAADVQEIVAAFNTMNARVSQATDYQIGLLRSIGHDLKGPLAAVERLVSDLGPNETREQIERRLGSVQGIVDSIMSFSRAVMRDGDMEETNLSEVLHTLADEQQDVGHDVPVEAPARLLVTCRLNATERCIRNLIENAIKYGGAARARLFEQSGEVVLWIDDDGPGVPQDELETVFQPFRRLAQDTQGTGLGLAIAQTIAIDQGGSLSLSNRPEGGVRAELRLPMSI
ncbi:MAG: ATP-binding protein [Pseudomonadota bacterium]